MVQLSEDDLVSGSWEACGTFEPGAEAAPVCERCGWLDHEHEQSRAHVHTLPERPGRHTVPARLAS